VRPLLSNLLDCVVCEGLRGLDSRGLSDLGDALLVAKDVWNNSRLCKVALLLNGVFVPEPRLYRIV